MPTSISDPTLTATDKQCIREYALTQGFEVAGFTEADFGDLPGQHLAEFIDQNRHGDMDWIVEKADRRRHPQALWPEVQTVLMLGLNYGPDADPLAFSGQSDRGLISVYAQGKDYHDVVKKKLKRIARWIVGTYGGDVKVFVDTAPVMEKPLAEAAGVGWQGKHTNLLSREFGSWLFLGSIFMTVTVPPDVAQQGTCGSCTACLDSCPTNAFPAPYQLDATRCISYLTIETRSHIPREMRALIGNRIYGCDDCLAVCPWNKYAAQAAEMVLRPRAELVAPRLQDLVSLDDAAFRALFSRSPVKRLGRNRFIRNVLIAIGNSGDPVHLGPVTELLEDPSPIIRVAAIWALSHLTSTEQFGLEKQRFSPQESDADVLAEWDSNERE
ncbi:tRNA epoxyqueuosine(34) reductase QueG [Sneathiella marina]|uniref:Epoxyqueuosine reductase n=1 Tax=Sneathiella marina TaxID=2950108 RepID=A0ABY4W2Z3_9PROT|nr:tRNA epoxyqueuosine(34) reductase QueG [Sneathiella marina]USG61551.1 tRNA epoxyqueuosine(34) reductase QueG [Sneathiella marina]